MRVPIRNNTTPAIPIIPGIKISIPILSHMNIAINPPTPNNDPVPNCKSQTS